MEDNNTVIVRLTKAQRTALQCAGLELACEPSEHALAAAWDGGRSLRFERSQSELINRALTDASNASTEAEITGSLAKMKKAGLITDEEGYWELTSAGTALKPNERSYLKPV